MLDFFKGQDEKQKKVRIACLMNTIEYQFELKEI
jgi:hypothetical protein